MKLVIGIVACLHGNELLGKHVIELLKKVSLRRGAFSFILANKEAMRQNKRFIHTDLNRCFPGSEKGNHEERLAAELMKQLEKCDYVIDIHSTTADTENFVVITKNQARKLAFSAPLKKLVIMQKAIAGNKSLIDNVNCGISIEFNRKTKAGHVKEIVLKTIENLIKGKQVKKEVYSVYGMKKKDKRDIQLTNFKKTTLDKEAFYPVLFGEKEYKDFLCLKAELIPEQINKSTFYQ